jgi:copper chaperone
MIAFQVNDMSCGHCVNAITQAIKAKDKEAQVRIDLGTHRVEIESGQADARVLHEAITQAGYTPVPV